MTPERLTAELHEQIPLTRAMALRVLRSEIGVVEISAPLAPNRNPHHSVFGGSLATLGIVCGWLLLNRGLEAEGLDAQLVIQNSECEFIAPAGDTCTAVAEMPQQEWPRFLAMLRRRGRARITVSTEIRVRGRRVLEHRGSYVALGVASPGLAGR
ncbi:MAG: YiiD C-terminal domain-containing protein [Stenotrophobium sp.]